MLQKCPAKLSSYIFLHKNEISSSQKLNAKLKNEDYFHMQNDLIGNVFSVRRKSIFKRRQVASIGQSVGRSVGPSVRQSVCPQKNFQKVLKKRFCQSNRYET